MMDRSSGYLANLFRSTGVSQDEVAQFTQQLATLLGAGLPLDRALQIQVDLGDGRVRRSGRGCGRRSRRFGRRRDRGVRLGVDGLLGAVVHLTDASRGWREA